MAIDLDRVSLWLEIITKLVGLVLTVMLIIVDVFFKAQGWIVSPLDFILPAAMMKLKADWLVALLGRTPRKLP